MNNLKLLFIGPLLSGKTYLANFLSESIEQMSGEYRPTQGVRIIEYEMPLTQRSKKTSAKIELWDVSGDTKFEACWPAIAKDANGVVFVYNQDQSAHEDELITWYEYFVKNQGIKENQCCVICHKKPNTADRDIVQLPSVFVNMPLLRSNIDEYGENIREDFNRYLNQLLSSLNESREQEELNIMRA